MSEIAPGITSISTSGHGGIHLTAERVAEMPEGLRQRTTWAGNDSQGGRWFEEDCDWSIVALSFPEHFDPYAVFCALRTYKCQRTDDFLYQTQVRYAKERGEPVPPKPEAPPDLFQGTPREKVETIARDFFEANRNGWEKAGYSFGPGSTGVRARFYKLESREESIRVVAAEEFYKLPPIVHMLPGQPLAI